MEEGLRQIASTGALSIPPAATTETGHGAVLSLSEYRRRVKESSMTLAEFDKLSDILLELSPDPHSESTSVMVSTPSSQTAPSFIWSPPFRCLHPPRALRVLRTLCGYGASGAEKETCLSGRSGRRHWCRGSYLRVAQVSSARGLPSSWTLVPFQTTYGYTPLPCACASVRRAQTRLCLQDGLTTTRACLQSPPPLVRRPRGARPYPAGP